MWYSIWNATVTALQFWIAGPEPHILSNVIDWVYTAFFYGDYTQQKWSLPEETIFSCFVTTLNNAFETELAQEDEGYESGSESLNIPTSLSRALRVYHVSTMEGLSFDPANLGQLPTTPEHHEEHSPWGYRHCRFTFCQLVFTSWDKESPVRPSGRCGQHSSINDRSPVCRLVAITSPEYHNLCHYLTPTQNTEQFSTDFDNVVWDNDATSTE